MKNRRIICRVIVGLLLCITAPTSFAENSPLVVASKYHNNDKVFNFWLQQSVNTIKSANLAVECGLVSASARSAALAAITSNLLGQARMAYGDGKGNISFHGAGEFYQAITALYRLNSVMSLRSAVGHKKPDHKTCTSLEQSRISVTLKKLIASGP